MYSSALMCHWYILFNPVCLPTMTYTSHLLFSVLIIESVLMFYLLFSSIPKPSHYYLIKYYKLCLSSLYINWPSLFCCIMTFSMVTEADWLLWLMFCHYILDLLLLYIDVCDRILLSILLIRSAGDCYIVAARRRLFAVLMRYVWWHYYGCITYLHSWPRRCEILMIWRLSTPRALAPVRSSLDDCNMMTCCCIATTDATTVFRPAPPVLLVPCYDIRRAILPLAWYLMCVSWHSRYACWYDCCLLMTLLILLWCLTILETHSLILCVSSIPSPCDKIPLTC